MSKGMLTTWIEEAEVKYSDERLDVDFIINEDYAKAVQELVDVARADSGTTGEPAYRMLQILTRLNGKVDM